MKAYIKRIDRLLFLRCLICIYAKYAEDSSCVFLTSLYNMSRFRKYSGSEWHHSIWLNNCHLQRYPGIQRQKLEIPFMSMEEESGDFKV